MNPETPTFFLLFGFNKGTPKRQKGKSVLLGNLANRVLAFRVLGFQGFGV